MRTNAEYNRQITDNKKTNRYLIELNNLIQSIKTNDELKINKLIG